MRLFRKISASLALIIILPAAAPAVPGPDVAAASDTVHSFSGSSALGRTGAYSGALSVRNMTCRSGRRLQRTARFRGENVALRGWSGRLIGFYGDGGRYRCTRASRALRPEAGG
jgi:hypothetical protein